MLNQFMFAALKKAQLPISEMWVCSPPFTAQNIKIVSLFYVKRVKTVFRKETIIKTIQETNRNLTFYSILFFPVFLSELSGQFIV